MATKEDVVSAEGPQAPLPQNGERELATLARQITDLHDAEAVVIERGNEQQATVLVLPQGRRAIDPTPFLEAQREFPKRIRGRARLATPESFIAHVNRFKAIDTAIFADVLTEKPKLVARYDYHGKDTPRWQEHSAHYDFPVSPEWKSWVDKNGTLMDMEAFAFFLEERIMDVLHPQSVQDEQIDKITNLLSLDWASPQQLLQLSKSLHIKTEAKVTEITDIQGGKRNIAFEERDTDKDGNTLTLPGGFLISVPVFDGSQPWLIPVMLRYRKQPGSKVQFRYELYRKDQYVLASTRETCERIESATGMPLFYGKPEASLGLKSETALE